MRKLIKYIIWIVITFILCISLRLFVFEIYHIPSGSMENTLIEGDYILVNKLYYGARIPNSLFEVPWLNLIPFFISTSEDIEQYYKRAFNTKRIFRYSTIQQNDIVVFNQPHNQHIHCIKRCIGLPGDTLEIINSEIFINRRKIIESPNVKNEYAVLFNRTDTSFSDLLNKIKIPYNEDWYQRKTSAKHVFLTVKQKNKLQHFINLKDIQLLSYNYSSTIIPQRNSMNIQSCYFFLGDNRNVSSDSRSFGFVSENQIIGKATHIIFSRTKEGTWCKDRWWKKIE